MAHAFSRKVVNVGEAPTELGAGEYRVSHQGVLIKCPDCGNTFTLRAKNVNRATGKGSDNPNGASKKVKCPHAGCNWKDHVDLADCAAENATEKILAAGGGIDAEEPNEV